ncbi:proton channel OTOP2-like [Lissotriton helveticus]
MAKHQFGLYNRIVQRSGLLSHIGGGRQPDKDGTLYSMQELANGGTNRTVTDESMITTQRSTMLVSSTSVNSCQIPEDKSNEANLSQNSLMSSFNSGSSRNSRSMEGANEAWQTSPDPKISSLLSLFYLILLTFSGSAILLSEIHHHSLQSRNIHGFLILLMLTSSGWMLWFGWRSAKNKKRKMNQDPHAGASWLKGGLALFALATLVLDCLTLGFYHELQHCMSVLITAFPIVQAVFTVIQVSILSFYAKVCIQDRQQLNRFGLMHTLATNILMWMSVVLDESMKQLEEIYHAQEKDSVAPLHDSQHFNSCVCVTNLCNIFHEGADYLHPFNIEFSLFSSTMLYVIWKNTGNISNLPEPSGQKKEHFHIVGAFGGLILGALAISATFGVMISFGVLAKSPKTVPKALRTYYIFNSVLLSAMFIACLIGIATYKVKRSQLYLDRSKSVVRSLDITLLLGTSCGPLMVSIFSLVAIFFVHDDDNLHLLDLCFSLCKCVQILGQNLFITEALHSGPARKPHPLPTDWVFSISVGSNDEVIQNPIHSVSSDYGSRCTSHSGTESHPPTKYIVDVEKDVHHNMISCSSFSDVSQKQANRSGRKHKMLSTRKKILQNISILLIFYNISVWILYAYGTRPHLVSQIEQSFYGFTLWVIIVKISLPLGIFYRMHSVASLFEVYCKTC